MKHLRPGILLTLALSAICLLPTHAAAGLEWIRVGKDGVSFVRGEGKFLVWGFNYDRDAAGRLLEDYWDKEWSTVQEDFREMKDLGANVVRVHLQLAKFMASEQQPRRESLRRLGELVELAEKSGLHLDVTGLGCYHKQDVPGWYDALDESARWRVQARFWAAVAETCAQSPAVFCFDLMNEPILPGDKPEREWLAGELAGNFYVQRISLSLAGRTQETVARAWVNQLVIAIREHDKHHLVTVAEIPWAMVFPGAKSIFHTRKVGEHLDFVSVHFYPEAKQVPKALEALSVYAVGKPVLIEEMFPLKCSLEELDAFVTGSRAVASGWLGFYWGKTIEEYRKAQPTVEERLTRAWLEYFRQKAPTMKATEL